MENKKSIAHPFVKWAGGKRSLLNKIENSLPQHMKKDKEIELYVEPFIGGGALFFYLKENFNIKKSIISDINSDLILLYKVVKLYPLELIENLKIIENMYLSKNEEQRLNFFKDIKSKFNSNLINFDYNKFNNNWINQATYFVFLNRTCFNGLFRVNSKGFFNVPSGKYKNPRICDKQNIINASAILKDTVILNSNYTDIEYKDSKNTLVYFDPPYRPVSTSSSFTTYSKGGFNDSNQEELANLYKKLDKEGKYLILSNSDSGFFDNLYCNYNIKRISTKRMINCKASGRTAINDIIVTNYKY